MPDSIIPTPAERAIRRRIARRGPIAFAEYMDAALYGPGGYYTRAAVAANAGPDADAADANAAANPLADYYTAPQVHPAFGALLSIQLFHCWTLLDRPRPFAVIEPGAGDGLLGRDILTTAAHLPDGFGAAIRYTLCDRRPHPGWERGFANARRIVGDFIPNAAALRLPPGGYHCVISNELLDALPVHRVRMDSGRLRELYVAIAPDVADGYEGPLLELAGAPSTPQLQRRLDDLGIILADGQTAEICLRLDDWASAASGALAASGFVITIDYGRDAADLYDAAQRPHGALVTYRRHRQTDAPLSDAGRQDITAPVDFTAVRQAGARVGLDTVGEVAQGWLLHRLGLQTLRCAGPPSDYGSGAGWQTLPSSPDGLPPDYLPPDFGTAAADDDGIAWRTNLTHLARPGGLGDFRVLIQSKGVAEPAATAALAWLSDGAAGASGASDYAYTPAYLASLLPADALRLGPERLRIGGTAPAASMMI